MRALAIADRESAPTVQDVPSVEPGPGQVRVAVEAASVNGIDAVAAAGYLWEMMPHTFPVVLGRDFVGTVAAVGGGAGRWMVGDRVLGVITAMELGAGSIAESVTVDAAGLVAVPEDVSAVEAAAVGLAGVTAADVVSALALDADDVVLVSGASGGVGAFVVQLAAATGARVLATARPGDAATFVTELGADAAVDHTVDLAAAVRAVAPDGVTAVAHLAGDPAALGALLRPGGRLASVLGATSEQVGRDDVTVTAVRGTPTPETFARLLDAVASKTLSVPVQRTYDLADAATAISDFGAPKRGKLVVTSS